MSQRTSGGKKAVSDGLARQIGRMFEDFARRYPGGLDRMELAKGDPGLEAAFHALCDERATLRVQTIAIAERPAWKTINLGTHKDNAELRQAITDAGCKLSNWGSDILDKRDVASEPQTLDLVLVTVAELGFPNGARRDAIYEKAQSLGLSICPAEVGPQLRLQYTDQPKGEWVVVAMELIVDSDGDPDVFCVAHGHEDRWLYGHYGDPPSFWNGDKRWVFCRKYFHFFSFDI